jgi:hypothetical protein
MTITPRTDHLIDLALDEDAGLGDVTSRAIFPVQHTSRAFIEAKQDLVVCGLDVAARVFARVDPALKVTLIAHDGERVKTGGVVLRITGPTAALLTAERTALNFIQRLSGVATLSQIDKSLDECSLMLRHGSFATLRRVVLPLLRPAIVAALVYSFVRAITSVSAVVFLVSAEYNLATAYIVNRVEVSDYGVAIAYASELVVIMAVGVGLIQLVVGERRLGRRGGASSILREASA